MLQKFKKFLDETKENVQESGRHREQQAGWMFTDVAHWALHGASS